MTSPSFKWFGSRSTLGGTKSFDHSSSHTVLGRRVWLEVWLIDMWAVSWGRVAVFGSLPGDRAVVGFGEGRRDGINSKLQTKRLQNNFLLASLTDLLENQRVRTV